MQIPIEKYHRMEAALRNILEISNDEFSISQAKYGLGIKDENEYTCRADVCRNFNFD
ncbi:hypothetical protein [Paenibacillus polymyxa]|uniref:hypothetical protein n=1 Tax=Paenibacillus polymyxa TaxID=1406 RepID=UPI0025B68FAC|nr:hypothetical protein [Paenibacillus polymyxa]MDN4090947.1 hypothetical protein [Paenibacillus polymyxa]